MTKEQKPPEDESRQEMSVRLCKAWVPLVLNTVYEREIDPEEPDEAELVDGLKDLVADLMHYVASMGMEWDDIADSASQSFRQESKDDSREAKQKEQDTNGKS